MIPLVATVVLITVVGWSLNRCIDYNEVFLNSGRYRAMLLGGNAVAVVLTICIVVWNCRAANDIEG